MKTIQGMLAQYFIMMNENIHIEFISSSNKLSQLVKTYLPVAVENNFVINEVENLEPKVLSKNTEKMKNEKKTYKQNKTDGLELCKNIIDKYEPFICWKYMLDTKKPDDLADCFLQGIWYLRKMKYIT